MARLFCLPRLPCLFSNARRESALAGPPKTRWRQSNEVSLLLPPPPPLACSSAAASAAGLLVRRAAMPKSRTAPRRFPFSLVGWRFNECPLPSGPGASILACLRPPSHFASPVWLAGWRACLALQCQPDMQNGFGSWLPRAIGVSLKILC
jgi:hypothetical protein